MSSWFSGIADRAESFLNQIDQATATSLQEVGIGTPSPNKPHGVVIPSTEEKSTGLSYEPVAQPDFTPLSQKSSESKFAKSFKKPVSDLKPKTTDPLPQRPPKPHSGMSTSLDNDSLMSFLNTPSTKAKGRSNATPTRPKSASGQQKDKKESTKTETQWNIGSGWDTVDSGYKTLSDAERPSSAQAQSTNSSRHTKKDHPSTDDQDSSNCSVSTVPPIMDLSVAATPHPCVEQGEEEEKNHGSTLFRDEDSYPASLSDPDVHSVTQSDSKTGTGLDFDFGNYNSPVKLQSESNSHTDPQSHSDNNVLTLSESNTESSSAPLPSLPIVNPNISFSNPDSYPDSASEPDSSGLPSPVVLQPGGVLGQQPRKELFVAKDKTPAATTTNVELSNLEQENQVLRQEIGSLSEELSAIKIRSTENQRVEYKEEVRTLREQCSRLEGHLRHMRSQEDDLTSSLEARDSQINILRMRLEESDQLVSTLRAKVDEREKEKERLMHDVLLSSSAQNQALESVNAQLKQTQAQLASEREDKATLRNEIADRETQFLNEKGQLSEALRSEQIKTQQFQFQLGETQKSFQKMQSEAQQIKREFEEYKIKATTVLQNKERVIASLQSPNGGREGQPSAHELALEEAKVEKQHLLSQLKLSQEQVTSLREELQNMEDQHVIEMEQVSQQLRLSEESLEQEKRRHTGTQEDFKRLNEELDSLKNDHVREKGMLSAQLREKENEVLVLSTRIAAIGTSQLDSSRRDLEGRLQELTESLIQKQTTLEMLSSEKNSLYLQLEKSNAALAKAESTMNMRQTALEMDESGRQVSTQLRPMASILPSSRDDGGMTKRRHLNKVKSTLDQMDRIGLHIGWVLRRYPWVRLLLVAYILLLHFWVTFVLLTYQPEVHT